MLLLSRASGCLDVVQSSMERSGYQSAALNPGATLFAFRHAKRARASRGRLPIHCSYIEKCSMFLLQIVDNIMESRLRVEIAAADLPRTPPCITLSRRTKTPR